jgi:hypothetical protein
MHHRFHIVSRHCRDRHPTKNRLDVPGDPATVGNQRGLLFGDLSPGKQATSFGIRQIQVTEFRNRCGRPSDHLVGGGIAALADLAQQSDGFITSHIGCPRRAVPTDPMETLPPGGGAIFEDVDDSWADLPTCAEPGHEAIPDDLTGLQRADFSYPNSVFGLHPPRSRLVGGHLCHGRSTTADMPIQCAGRTSQLPGDFGGSQVARRQHRFGGSHLDLVQRWRTTTDPTAGATGRQCAPSPFLKKLDLELT